MEVVAEDIPKENTVNALPQNSNNDKTPSPPPDIPKKSRKEDKSSKKDDKNVEQFMKSLNSISNVDEKLSLVCKKYVQISDENKKLQFYNKQSEKRSALLLKEKEHLQHEFNKTILVKSKLENLCRELQKQNKAIKEESLLKIREEEERRKETQAKFQNTLSEITTLLQQNNEKNVKLRDDNISMSEKFKSVVQQYQQREQQVDKMAKQMALESQLSEAKLHKASLEHQAEKERFMAELEHLKVTAALDRAKVMELQGVESVLKTQIAVYTEKYDEFQNALVRSNQVFGGFKDQMEMMSKKIKKLEKESLSWKKRWETSQTALLDMCGERQASEERIAATTRQLHHMQSLCRTLQAERTVLLNSLKENNIERPPLPAVIPAPPASPVSSQTTANNAKVDAMVANCAQLRQSLAHLQTQLNVLTTNKNESKEELPKPEKQKKSKSKKNKGDKQAAKTDSDKSDVKETESDEPNATKDVPDILISVNQPNAEVGDEPNASVAPIENKSDLSSADDKINNKMMETLIQAINMANMNLCHLEAANSEVNNKIDEMNDVADENDVPFEELKGVSEVPVPLDENDTNKGISEVTLNATEKMSEIIDSNPNEEVSYMVEVKSISKEES